MGKWFLGDAERHRPFHTRSIALALAILITFGLFSPLCVAATPSYEIDSGNIVGSQNIGTLNGYNLYLVNISKQYDTIKLQEGNDSSTGELVSFLYGDGDYDGITGGSITRNSTNFKKTATYFQKEKSNILLPPDRGNNVGGGYPAGVSGTSRVFRRCIAGNGSGYFRNLFALFGFSCLSVFHAANVGIVDLHSLRRVFGPLHTNNFLKRLII